MYFQKKYTINFLKQNQLLIKFNKVMKNETPQRKIFAFLRRRRRLDEPTNLVSPRRRLIVTKQELEVSRTKTDKRPRGVICGLLTALLRSL
ncbi:hypothetical protein KCU93_g504, partial [Aureobasidium melanogenum]